jgi:glycosyltransferase involved in cell wall biosynthesis
MRIVHIVDYFQPKLGYQEVFLAKKQAKLGHEVFVITSDRYAPILYYKNAGKSILGDRIKGYGFFMEDEINVWRLKVLFEVSSRVWMLGLENKIRELNPDIVNVDGFNTITAFRVALLKLKSEKYFKFKLVIDDHLNPSASKSQLKILYPVLKHSFFPIISALADSLIAVSNTTKVFMHKNYGLPLNRIKVIPLGADITIFKCDKIARNKLRKELGIKNNEVLFIYTGKIVTFKYVHLLVDAAMSLIKKHYNLKVLLVGYSDKLYREQLQLKITSEGCVENFIWHEAVPNKELYKYFSTADIAVWPHQHTNSILEAMACGLPVIVSDEPRASEEVIYKNGLTYKDSNLLDLMKKMEELALNETLRKKMGENGKKIVQEKFNWEIIAKEFIKIYGEG